MRKHLLGIALCLPLLGGCSFWLTGENLETRTGSSSSLVNYLYPNGERPPARDDQLPRLELPLRVGIAFVPGNNREILAGAEQQALLERVADTFRERPFITGIDVIPTQYLQNARGVMGMQQVAALFDVDVVALVSYDQLVLSSERDSSLLYWTIVGTMIFKGNSNEVQTLIDTAVFDVGSGKLLMRAPGTHRVQKNSTLVDRDREQRDMQTTSFDAAAEQMAANLDTELERFREAVKAGQRAEVAWTGGGGGTVGHGGLLLLSGLLTMRWRRRPFLD